MRAVVMRVSAASVRVDGETVGEIGRGLLVLLGVREGDGEAEAKKLASKIVAMRIFEDENEKMNLSLGDVAGEMLAVSQFTLYGNCKKGRRPEFLQAARPEAAEPLYELFMTACRNLGISVEAGKFGAHMDVESCNDGPVTILLDTEAL